MQRYFKRLGFRYKFFEDSERTIDQIKPMLVVLPVVVIVWLIVSQTGVLLAHVAVTPKVALPTQPYDKPVTVTFSRPIKPTVTYSWRQNIAGTWRETSSFGMISKLVFLPEKHLPPGEILELTLSDVQPVVDFSSGTAKNHVVYVQVEPAPVLVAVTPQGGATNVLPDSVVQVTFSAPNHGLRQLILRGDLPLVSAKPTSKDDMIFEWKRSAELQQGKQYTATLIDTALPEGKQEVAVFSFTTVPKPQVKATHTGYLFSGHVLDLEFDTDMVQTEKAVQFDIAGNGVWQSPRRYRFTPTDFTQGKTWGYRVLAGAKSTAGGYFTEPQEFSVSTPGPVEIAYAVPSGNRVGTHMRIAVTFDRTVNHASAEAAFSIAPYVAGSFSWSNDTLIFTHAGLQPATQYTVRLAPGVRPVSYGVASTGYTMTFTTVR